MEIRRRLIIIVAFLIGTVIGSIPYTMALDCDNLPSFHVFHMTKIVDCFSQSDREQSERLDATNDVFFSEIERLDRKIENATRR